MAASDLKIAGMKLKIDGAAQFQSDLSLCSKQSASLKLDLKLLEAQTTSAGKNGVEYLRQKSANLTDQITTQREKTKLLNEALAELKSGAEVDAQQVAKLEREIYKSEVTTAELTRALGNNNEALAKVENQSLKTGKRMQEMGEKAKITGEKMASVGSSMSMMLTVPIAAAGVAAIKLASDYEESLNKVNVAYKDNSKEVIEWSETTLKQIGLAKGTSLDMAATYGDMATGMGFATDAASKMGTQLVERAADLASFKNISIDIANTALTSVFTGETESLKKLGVVMTEANLISYMQAEGYKKTYKELTQAEKVTLRYQYVMDATNNSAGDFARTIDGTANQSRLFQESLKELAITFGEDLLPVITPVIKGANTLIQSFGDLDEAQRKIVVGVALAVAAAGPLLVATGKGITAVGIITKALGEYKIKMVAAKLASDSLAASQTAATAAGAGLSAVLGPLAILAGSIALTAVAYNALAEDSRAATDAIIEQTDAMKATSEAFDTSITDANTSAAATKDMTDKLYALADVEKKSNAQKAEMKGLILSLNAALPDLNLEYDEQTDSLNKNEEAVYDLIDAKLAELKQAAYANQLTQLYQDQITQRDLYTKALDRYNIANKKMTEWGVNPIEGAKRTAEYYAAYDALMAVIEASDGTDASLKAVEEAFAGMALAAGESAKDVTEATELTQEELKAQQDAADQYYADLKKSFENHLAEMSNLEEKGIERSKLTAKELKENRDQQVKDYQDWRAGLKVIAELVPADVLEELEKLGPKYDQIIDDLAKMTPEQIAEFVESWRAPAEEAAKAAAEEMGKLPGEATTAGRQAGFNFEKALRESVAGIKIPPVPLTTYVSDRKSLPIPGFAVGTKYVPEDQLALIHKGEAIIPADQNPYNPAISLGGIATNKAMSGYGSSLSNVVNNSNTDASVAVNMAGATFVVREEADIDKIASLLALKVVASRKAVGG